MIYVRKEAIDFSAICNAEKTVFTSIDLYEFNMLEQKITKKHTWSLLLINDLLYDIIIANQIIFYTVLKNIRKTLN